MEIGSTRTALTFCNAFTLPFDLRKVPAGDYVLVTDEERLAGLTFNACRRISAHLVVGGGPVNPGRTEMIPLGEEDLDALIARDAAVPGKVQSMSSDLR